jgi:thiol-disulfide isomerase/thioredoxin
MRSLLLLCLAACSSAPVPGEKSEPVADAAPPPREPAAPSAPDAAATDWGPQYCPPGTGFEVGDAIGDLGVKDCDTGADATIDEVCGASATWIFVAHTHCPTCQATAAFTDEVAAAVAGQNVAIVHIVYDDSGTTCAQWRAAYKLAGIPNVRVYEDPRAAVWSKIRTQGSTAPSAILDRRRVITVKQHAMTKDAILRELAYARTRP